MEFMNQEHTTNPDIDVDALLSEINQPEAERAMSSEETPQQPSPQAAAPVAPQEFEFDWNGNKIKAPLEKLTKWASQGYDYSQKMEKFKADQAETQKLKQQYSKYQTIDEYVKKDPNWWTHVEQSYNNRLASEDPIVQRVNGMLEEKLAPFTEILAQREQAETQAKIQKEDTALAQDIKSIQEKYSDLDFSTPDQSGKSLELKVLEHGAANGFPNFRAAFFDFYQDQLEKRAEARGREAVSKDALKHQKLGLSGTPQTPRRKPTDDFDVRGKNYNQILNDILETL